MTSTPLRPAVWFPAIRANSGTDVFTERLAQGLHKRGIQAEIAWLPQRAEYAPWTVATPKPPPWANIVHVNTWLHRRFLPSNIPVVATVHACVHDPALTPYKGRAQALYHRFWIRPIEARIFRRANAVVAVSHYTAKRTEVAFGIGKITIIANAIDTQHGSFHPDRRTSPQQRFRMLYVGNWSIRKGVDLLAPIMGHLGEAFELYYTVDRHGLHEHYAIPKNGHCLGRYETADELADAYRNADALLFPSRLEGLPLTVLEAQACGLPVIATNGSSLPEAVENGVSGLLCLQNDARAFANAARQLASNPERWVRMKQAARKRIEERFSHEAMIDRYLDVYRTVLSKS